MRFETSEGTSVQFEDAFGLEQEFSLAYHRKYVKKLYRDTVKEINKVSNEYWKELQAKREELNDE